MHVIDVAALTPTVQAVVLVGAILVEAVVLYVGYGAVEHVATRPVIELLKDA